MAKINFYLKDIKSLKETPLVIIIWEQGIKLKIPSYKSIHPDFWDNDNFEAKHTKKNPTYPEFNKSLRDTKSKIEKYILEYREKLDGKPIDKFELQSYLKNKINPKPISQKPIVIKELDLKGLIDEYFSDVSTKLHYKTNKPISIQTKKSYRSGYSQILQFIDKFYKNRPFTFDMVDAQLYKKYKSFLIIDQNFKINTAGKYINILKSCFMDGMARGLLPRFVPSQWIKVTEEVEAIYINEYELEHLHNMDLSGNPRLDRVRDLFILASWTGLRVSDWKRLRAEHFENDFITILTQKTKAVVKVPLHPHIKSMMRKYNGITENSLPKPISDQKMNDYLKELGELAGFNEKITRTYTKGGIAVTVSNFKYELMANHTGRRNFATNLFKQGFAVGKIMMITGHKTETEFFKYIRMTPNETAEDLKNFWDNRELAKSNFKIA